jgi:hypothetical protein
MSLEGVTKKVNIVMQGKGFTAVLLQWQLVWKEIQERTVFQKPKEERAFEEKGRKSSQLCQMLLIGKWGDGERNTGFDIYLLWMFVTLIRGK